MIYSIPLLLLSFFAAEPTPPGSPGDQLVELAKEGAAIKNSFYAALKEAGHDRPRVIAANEKYRADSLAWAKRASALLKAHPAEPATLDVILTMNQIYYVDDETVAILRERHFGSPKVFTLINSFSQDSRRSIKISRRIGKESRGLPVFKAERHNTCSVFQRKRIPLKILDRSRTIRSM